MLVVSEENHLRSLLDAVATLCTAVLVKCLATTPGPQTSVTGYHGNVSSSNSSSRCGVGAEMPDEQRLLTTLLRTYDPGIRPVFNVSQNVVVNFSLTLVQIMDMVRK